MLDPFEGHQRLAYASWALCDMSMSGRVVVHYWTGVLLTMTHCEDQKHKRYMLRVSLVGSKLVWALCRRSCKRRLCMCMCLRRTVEVI